MSSNRSSPKGTASHGALEVMQSVVLREILQGNKACRYGRRSNFGDISKYQQYRALPVMTYDKAPGGASYWVEPQNFCSEHLMAYFLTSGTSSSPKRVPVTPSLVRQKSKAFSIYWKSIYEQHPNLKTGSFIANFADSGYSHRNDKGVLELSETTFWNQRMQGFQDSKRWPLGKSLHKVTPADLRYFAAARLALQGPLHCIMTLNPSTVVRLCREIEGRAIALESGLRTGTWGMSALDDSGTVSSELAERLVQSSGAADRVAAAIGQTQNGLRLRNLWPELELIICWQSQLVEPYLKLLREYADGVDFRDYITQSSECIIAIPLEDNRSGGILAYESHFFEFIPETQTDKDDPDVIPAWKVEKGQRYEVVVTTGGGLYRYRTGDCVLVESTEGEAPYLNFQYRLGKSSSITGEKITEAQVLEALGSVEMPPGTLASDVIFFPRTGEHPHYAAIMPIPNASLDTRRISTWLQAFEKSLCSANSEYKDKRSSERLGHPRVLLVSKEAHADLEAKFRAEHVGDDQYKPGVLRKQQDLDDGVDVLEEVLANC